MKNKYWLIFLIGLIIGGLIGYFSGRFYFAGLVIAFFLVAGQRPYTNVKADPKATEYSTHFLRLMMIGVAGFILGGILGLVL